MTLTLALILITLFTLFSPFLFFIILKALQPEQTHDKLIPVRQLTPEQIMKNRAEIALLNKEKE